MRQLKNKQLIALTSCFLISVFFTASPCISQVTVTVAQDDITQAINNDRWDFSADFAQPSYGRSRTITGTYYVKLRKDTVFFALPYYGKINSPAGVNNENPLDFTSTDFKITKETRKKGGWLVTVKPTNSEVQSVTFTFFDNGSAQANFIMTNRSGINFSGKVTAAK